MNLIPDAMIKGISKSLLLGACGMPGNTAYFGLLELCQPKGSIKYYVIKILSLLNPPIQSVIKRFK